MDVLDRAHAYAETDKGIAGLAVRLKADAADLLVATVDTLFRNTFNFQQVIVHTLRLEVSFSHFLFLLDDLLQPQLDLA